VIERFEPESRRRFTTQFGERAMRASSSWAFVDAAPHA